MTLNILLYKKMYDDNKYFCYTRRRIMKYLFLLYKKTYNRNKYFYYTRRCIIETNIFIIQEEYNEIYVSDIHDDV